MATTQSPSKPISRGDCLKKMQLRTAFVSRKFEDIAEQAGVGTPTYNYFAPYNGRDQRNAYVFQKESILRILFGTDKIEELLTESGKSQLLKMPDTILAIMGAHHKDEGDFEKGQATVILIGTKEQQEATTGEKKYEIIPPHTLIAKDADSTKRKDGNSDEEMVGEEFPPSLVMPNPPINYVGKTEQENIKSRSFKII